MAPLSSKGDALTGAGAFRALHKAEGFEFVPFQRRFLKRSLKPGIVIAALSAPRGSGKSLLASRLLAEALPGGARFVAGSESVLLSGSMNQSRAVFRFLRAMFPCPDHQEKKCRACGLRWVDSLQRIGVTHWASDTRITVRGKSGKLALGLVNAPLLIGDEPAAWDVQAGQEMIDSLITSAGKTRQLLCLIGTLSPGAPGGWWRELIAAGSQPGVYIQKLEADPAKWSSWREVLRVNPVTKINGLLRDALRRELDEAKRDSRAKARFLSYRLNVPSADESTVLLTVDEFERIAGRDVSERVGRPTVGVDLGAGRAWSAATAVWPSGRTEAVAIAPGMPNLDGQEKRDRVPRGTYARLKADGVLTTDGDLRVPRVQTLIDRVMRWRPISISCDRFRLSELEDAVAGRVPVLPRGQRWSESSSDIRSLRRMALDGPLSVDESSRHLLAASLAASRVESDQQGSLRLIKSTRTNCGRDDAVVSWVLACGARDRVPVVAGLRRSLLV